MRTEEINSLLKATLSNVFVDFIPEGKPLPSSSFSFLASGFARTINGEKSGKWETWRVITKAANRQSVKAEFDKLVALDNTSSTDFNNIFVIAEGSITAQAGDKTRSRFVDLKVYY